MNWLGLSDGGCVLALFYRLAIELEALRCEPFTESCGAFAAASGYMSITVVVSFIKSVLSACNKWLLAIIIQIL